MTMKMSSSEETEDSNCDHPNSSPEDDSNDNYSVNYTGSVENASGVDEEIEEERNNDSDGSIPKNLAWADSISKILRTKSKDNKPIVLSKAKKLTEVKAKPKPAGFEVELSDGRVKQELVADPVLEKSENPKRKRKRELPDIRVKPNILEKDRERVLAKIATKGVVQLFNAVRAQQKDLKEKLDEVGSLEVKRAKVLKNLDKNTFLDVLMSEKSKIVDEVVEKTKISENYKKEDKTHKVWDVLRDNYMMDAKLKDWDKELQQVEEEIEME